MSKLTTLGIKKARAGRAHRIPLSNRAVEILELIIILSQCGGEAISGLHNVAAPLGFRTRATPPAASNRGLETVRTVFHRAA